MDKYNTPELHLKLIKILLSSIGDCLNNNNIKWFADGGTLLGALRHHDIIPWDDDADIGIENRYWRKVLPSLKAHFNNASIKIDDKVHPILLQQSSEDLIKVYVPELWANTESGKLIATPTVDIFRYKINNDDIVELYTEQTRNQFPKSFYEYNELFPIKKCDFGGIKINCANNGMPYVHRFYGSDCMNKGRIDIRTPSDKSILDKNRESIEVDL